MASPAMIAPCLQAGPMECVIACMSMILGLPYIDVVAACQAVDPNALKTGLTAGEACRAAKRLGHVLTAFAPLKVPKGKRSIPLEDLDDLTGILYVRKGNAYHAVVLFEGVVFDPSYGNIWQLASYLATHHVKPYRILLP